VIGSTFFSEDSVNTLNTVYVGPTVFRKKHPVLFSNITLRKSNQLNENFRQNR